MADFSKEIDNFQKYGTYDYEFDEGGNLIFKKNPEHFTEQYLSIPLIDYVYSDQKIGSFYNTEFSEFFPTVVQTETPIENQEISNLEIENQELKERLSVLTEKVDESITDAERLAIKQIIIELRIALKQGIAERDFSTTFPYLPITKS
jgi:hypothetical protein